MAISGLDDIILKKLKQKCEHLDMMVMVKIIQCMEECGFAMIKLMKVNQFQRQILFLMVGEKEGFARNDFESSISR